MKQPKRGRPSAKAKIIALKKQLKELNEVITPFVLHGKALGALKRMDIATTVSQHGSSYLSIGAFQLLLETVDPKEFRL